MKETKTICEECVHIENSGLDIKYAFTETKADNKPLYGFKAELYENDVLTGTEEAVAVAELSKAIKLYGLIIKNKVTPIDLKYVIEDFG